MHKCLFWKIDTAIFGDWPVKVLDVKNHKCILTFSFYFVEHFFYFLIYSSFLDKYFQKNHKFHSIFNRNNVKVYSYTKNINSIITNHNKMILAKSETSNKEKCNCIYKNTCSLKGECQAKSFIYQASLNSNELNYDEK